MAIAQPQSSDYFNSPDHATLHRIIAADTGAAAQTIIVDSSSNVGINEVSPGARLDITVDDNDNVIGLMVDQNDTTNNKIAAQIENAGTGDTIYVIHTGATGRGLNAVSSTTTEIVRLDQNGNGRAMTIDKDVTDSNNSNNTINLYNTSVVTDAATYTKTGTVVLIVSNVLETSGTITDSAIVVSVQQTHADATGDVVSLVNAGTGDSLSIDHNNSGVAINIDMDVNSASAMYGIKIAVDNAGAGLEYAFDFDSASLERAAGTETTTKNVRVMDSGGAEYYLKIYSVA